MGWTPSKETIFTNMCVLVFVGVKDERGVKSQGTKRTVKGLALKINQILKIWACSVAAQLWRSSLGRMAFKDVNRGSSDLISLYLGGVKAFGGNALKLCRQCGLVFPFSPLMMRTFEHGPLIKRTQLPAKEIFVFSQNTVTVSRFGRTADAFMQIYWTSSWLLLQRR